MEHSKNYSKVKLWHSMKMWNETRVRNAVKMGWITKEEFAEITGKKITNECSVRRRKRVKIRKRLRTRSSCIDMLILPYAKGIWC